MKKSILFLVVVATFLAACGGGAKATEVPVKPTKEVPPIKQTQRAALESGTPNPHYTAKPTKQPITGPIARVNAYCTLIGKPAETKVAQGTTIVLIWGWLAATQEQVQSHIDQSQIVVTLDGQPVTDPRQERIQATDDGKFTVVWGSNVGILPVGTHTITYSVSWKVQITNGVDTFGPGGKFETQADTCQLTIQ
jgi:hypothetical protein